MLINVDKTQI